MSIMNRLNLQRLLATTAFVAAVSAASAQTYDANNTAVVVTGVTVSGAPTNISGTAIISGTATPAVVISGTGGVLSSTLNISSTATISATGAGGAVSLSTWNGLTEGVVVNNSGTILNNTTNGVALNLAGAPAGLNVSSTINNTGTISGSIALGSNQIIYNSTGGSLTGNITTTNPSTTTFGDSVTLTNGTITGNVDLGAGANTVTISGTSAYLRGNLTGGAGVDTLSLTNGAISGTVNLGDGANVVTISNAGLTTGATNALTLGGGADTVTLESANVSGTMAFGGGTDRLYVSGTAFTTKGAITDLETLGISNTTNVRHSIGGLATVGVASGARLNTSESLVLTGALTNAGTIDIEAGKNLEFDSTSSDVATGKFIFGLTSGTTGTISVTTAGLTMTNTSVTIKTDASSGFIASGTTRLLIDTADTTTINANALTTSQTGVYRYSLSLINTNNDILLTIGRISTSDVVESATGKAIANALDTLGASASNTLLTVQGVIGSQDTAAGVNNVVESLAPAVDAGLGNTAIGVNVATSNQVSNRLASLRDGTALSGLNTGDGTYTRNIWVEGFGGTTKQDDKNGAKGYDANSYGMSFGVDTDELVQDATVGAAFTYAMGTVDSNASSNASTDINTYIGTLYGSKTYDNGLFTNAQASVGTGAYESERTVIGVGTAKGEFDGLQASLKGEVGKDFAMDALTLTPVAGLQYNYLDLDKYTETGAGGANLTVKSKSMSTVDASVGGKAAYTMPLENGGTLKPSVHAKYVYRMGDDTLETTSNFTGGGNAFNTTGVKSDRSSVNLGTGLLLTTAAGMDLSAEYNADLRSSLTGHTGQLKARWAF
jgi:outer membrane autotransporter protein